MGALPLLVALLATASIDRDLAPATAEETNQFVGTWQELARFPEIYGKHCFRNWVRFEPDDDGGLRASSGCNKGAPDGPMKVYKARAWVLRDAEGHLTVRVLFLRLFERYAQIVELGPRGDWVAVGSADRKHLSIASRSGYMDPDDWKALLDRLEKRGFDTSRLVIIPR